MNQSGRIMQDVGSDLTSTYVTLLEQGRYKELTEQCERAIESDPSVAYHYWYLGLALLLHGQESDAQITWMTPMLEAEPSQAEDWARELALIIQTEAERQTNHAAYETAWLLRQHLRELIPDDLDNLLNVLELSFKANNFSFADEAFKQSEQRLQYATESELEISTDLLLRVVQRLLNFDSEHPATLNFLNICIPHVTATQKIPQFVDLLLTQAMQNFQVSQIGVAIQLATLSLQLLPTYPRALSYAVFFMQSGNAESLINSIPLSKQRLALSQTITDQISAAHDVLTSLMSTCQSWQETQQYYQQYKTLLASLVTTATTDSLATKPQPSFEGQDKLHELLAMGMFNFYFEDDPVVHRPVRNQVARLAQEQWRSVLPDHVETYRHRASINTKANKPLKLGYLSSCLRIHSVGWLVRWLLEHHDRDRFDIHLYSTRRSNDPLQQAFVNAYGDRFHHLPNSATDIATQIEQDQIDILVDLDSMTAFDTCVVMALKPAPVQVSWLGCDASGIPAVDYYIVDPYVVPANAQDYYSETLWRLPQTYIAVDGFEVGVPSLRRDQLGIPNDAIVYLSSQTGLKRNPDNIRLQLQILKQVPNSYFLVKSFNAQPELLQSFFLQLAEEEGVSGDRFRFLPDFAENSTYRANLGLADVVLDTYPYNGATTTLEALWVGLPIVTRVGEQFAARNSYTMMMNAGVQAGIAWTDEEYLEWGIRLGTDANLRQKISYQLRRSRNVAPLWNTNQFAREIEKAYEQMWNHNSQS
ncbi:MAG: hypothetical protein Kow00121_42950 [Elainellaceae cyanobacterium]